MNDNKAAGDSRTSDSTDFLPIQWRISVLVDTSPWAGVLGSHFPTNKSGVDPLHPNAALVFDPRVIAKSYAAGNLSNVAETALAEVEKAACTVSSWLSKSEEVKAAVAAGLARAVEFHDRHSSASFATRVEDLSYLSSQDTDLLSPMSLLVEGYVGQQAEGSMCYGSDRHVIESLPLKLFMRRAEEVGASAANMQKQYDEEMRTLRRALYHSACNIRGQVSAAYQRSLAARATAVSNMQIAASVSELVALTQQRLRVETASLQFMIQQTQAQQAAASTAAAATESRQPESASAAPSIQITGAVGPAPGAADGPSKDGSVINHDGGPY